MRLIWRIVADTPSAFSASGGNISGDLIGPQMFGDLILPHFQGEAAAMPPAGKRIRATAIDLLRQAAPGNAFVVGITENVPTNVAEESLRRIAETLNEFGACPVVAGNLPV